MMYSLSNFAKIVGVTTRTARQWVHSGKIKAIKYPGSNRWYVSQEEIDRIKGESN